MPDKFEISLRSKSAEQLLNMSQNRDLWSTQQLSFIDNEVKKRGLEIFEEPEPWDEEQMNNMNTSSPQSDFERDMAVILAYRNKEKSTTGIALAAQIISIASLVAIFTTGLFISLDFYVLTTLAVLSAFIALGLSITKVYLISIIVGIVSLLLNVTILLLFLEEIL